MNTPPADPRVPHILQQVYEAADAGEAADLSQLCADPELEARVRDILAQDPLLEEAFIALRRDLTVMPGVSDRLGPYHIDGPLGEGGMGRVFRATDTRNHAQVALKVQRVAEDLMRLRFQREAEIAAALDHPHIVPILDIGQDRDLAWIAMKLIEGPPLDEWARERTMAALANAGAKIARALHAAHLMGVVHRDIKPPNILMDGDEPVVLDFGLARSKDLTRVTREGAALGTLPYMAPEQLVGDSELIDARTDVYALGATLYETIHGSPPFAGDSAERLAHEIITSDPRPLRLSGKESQLETIILQALAKSPSRRYASAAKLADDLERYQRDETILARRSGPASHLWRRARRYPRTVTGIALLLLATAIAVAFGYSKYRDEQLRFRTDVARCESLIDQRLLSTATASLAPWISARPNNPDVRRIKAKLDARNALEDLLDGIHGSAALGPQHLAMLSERVTESGAERFFEADVHLARVMLAVIAQDFEGFAEKHLTRVMRTNFPRATNVALAIAEGRFVAETLGEVAAKSPDDNLGVASMLRVANAPLELRERVVWEGAQQDPTHFRLAFERARVFHDLGQHDRSHDTWFGMQMMGRKTHVVLRNLAVEAAAMGQFDRAETYLSSAIGTFPSLAPEARVWVDLALQRGDIDALTQRIEACLARWPDDGGLLLLRAKAELAIADGVIAPPEGSPHDPMGHEQRAAAFLRQVLALPGPQPLANAARLTLLRLEFRDVHRTAATQEPARVTERLEDILRRLAEPLPAIVERENLADAHFLMGQIAGLLAQPVVALDHFAQALKAEPSHVDACRFYAAIAFELPSDLPERQRFVEAAIGHLEDWFSRERSHVRYLRPRDVFDLHYAATLLNRSAEDVALARDHARKALNLADANDFANVSAQVAYLDRVLGN